MSRSQDRKTFMAGSKQQRQTIERNPTSRHRTYSQRSHNIHDKWSALPKRKSVDENITSNGAVRKKRNTKRNNDELISQNRNALIAGSEQQNNDLVVAVMAIAMALQPERRSASNAAPDGIELD